MYLLEEGIELAQVHENKELPEGTASFHPWMWTLQAPDSKAREQPVFLQVWV